MDYSKILVFFILINASQSRRKERNYSLIPGTVFFDLDFTLWPYWVDTTALPPFHKNETTGEVIDSKGKIIKCYPEVPEIFEYLKKLGVRIGICSSSIAVQESKQLIELFGWNKYIDIEEIYPISKDISLNKMKEKYEFALPDVLFFDDEPHVHRRLKHIKVVSVPVKDGMTMELLKAGFQKFSDVRAKKVKL